ncbi:MAG: hypothetical protein ACK559_11665, partial [bacterium]
EVDEQPRLVVRPRIEPPAAPVEGVAEHQQRPRDVGAEDAAPVLEDPKRVVAHHLHLVVVDKARVQRRTAGEQVHGGGEGGEGEPEPAPLQQISVQGPLPARARPARRSPPGTSGRAPARPPRS